MTVLRGDEANKVYVFDKLKAVYSELLDCESQYAVDYVDWVMEKLLSNKKHIEESKINARIKQLRSKTDAASRKELFELKEKRKKILPKNYPASLVKGDIIYVKYGVGFGDELTNGHYGIILNRKGALYLIAPLTSTPQPYEGYNIHLKDLGLPGEGTKGSYVSFNHVRFLHYRRIEKIKGIKEGKKNIGAETAGKILENFFNMNKTMK